MTVRFTGNDNDGISLSQDNETWINRVGTAVTNASDAFKFNATSGNTLVVHGTIASSGASAVSSFDRSRDIEILVRETGFVRGATLGIDLVDGPHTIRNEGVVRGLDGTGILLLGSDNALLENGGTIDGARYGVYIRGNAADVTNRGVIDGGEDGGVTLDDARPTFLNTGTVRSEDTGVDFTEENTGTTFINRGVVRAGAGEASFDGQRRADDVTN